MGILIRNACLVDLDACSVRPGDLRVDNEQIEAIGPGLQPVRGDEIVNAGGAVVMPGMVNGHTHLYSALATGMPGPVRAPSNFHEILRFLWWRLDRALDLPLIEVSAELGALEALRCGTTTLIDHHASPNATDGSLDAIEAALSRVGVRGVLCYETTDRNGPAGRDAGLAENERYLRRCDLRENRSFAGLVGGHAAFTMGHAALEASADLARRYGVGVHIHIAEDACDAAISRELYGGEPLARLDRAGILELPSILAHGIHLSGRDIARINDSAASLAHNPRSNMNNAVGYAPIERVACPVMLGTDGIGSDMLAELRTAWFQSRDHHAGLTPMDCVGMLTASARRARAALRLELGALSVGAAADLVLTDYVPATPLTPANLAGHLLLGMSSRHVRSVMIAGEWRLLDGQVTGLDEQRLRHHAATEALRLWPRMSDLEE